jgi:CO/xanthine dehydrogenase Mo-binding subunit
VSEQLTKSTEFAGHNRISTQALTSVAKVAAADVLAVAPAQVRVTWHDDAGALALSISSAMGAPSLTDIRRNPGLAAHSGGSILARATAAKARILGQVELLSGSQLSRVDIRISGLIARTDGRVL